MKIPTRSRSVEKIIDEQIQKWHMTRKKNTQNDRDFPVITISRETGSGGSHIAAELATKYHLDLFDHEMINQMANSSQVGKQIIESLDEKGLSVLDDWIASLVDTKHLWPDQYLKHLMKVILTIGKHGKAVIVGRGANFILPPQNRLRVRIIGPVSKRVENVCIKYDVSLNKAKKLMIKAESDRRAFIRKYFYSDIGNSDNYDLIINTDTVTVESAVKVIVVASGMEPR